MTSVFDTVLVSTEFPLTTEDSVILEQLRKTYSEFALLHAQTKSENDSAARKKLHDRISDHMRKLVSTRAVARYAVTCDARNNTPKIVEFTDNLALRVEWVYINGGPVRVIKFTPF